MGSTPCLLALLLLLPLLPAQAGDDEGPARLSDLYRHVARLEVPTEEISGWSALPGTNDAGTRRFLVVSDEGRLDATERTVRGALFLLSFGVRGAEITGDGATVSLSSSVGVTLHLGEQIPRLDPAWVNGHSPLDLEACVPLPGTSDLYLLAGERNPEDVTDGGANRLYVIRHPAPADGGATSGEHADLLAYLRLPDLPDDAINDRLEAAVATPHPDDDSGRPHPNAGKPGASDAGTPDAGAPDAGAPSCGPPDRWLVFAFKERTVAEGRPPVYFPLLLERRRTAEGNDEFELSWTGAGPRSGLPALLPDRLRLGAQSDACLGPDGSLWVLDRWRREIHVARIPSPPAYELDHVRTVDAFDVLRGVPSEVSDGEPAAPGCAHPGYGRHEAMAFDAHGWLWLAADLGSGRPSTITILAPRSGVGTADASQNPGEQTNGD